ncbi:hypothetical protein JTB14_012417 [Gonioctena quinquepunctata]|nr:hypothetical protein JTB14_012417 [Gonioctena quinquepunctata]
MGLTIYLRFGKIGEFPYMTTERDKRKSRRNTEGRTPSSEEMATSFAESSSDSAILKQRREAELLGDKEISSTPDQ